MPTYIDNGDGTFSDESLAPFDPTAIANQIAQLQTQMAAAVDLATRNAEAQFQPQIDALTASLTAAATQVPSIADLPAVAAIPAVATALTQTAQQADPAQPSQQV